MNKINKIVMFTALIVFCNSLLADDGLGPYRMVTSGISNTGSQATNFIVTNDNRRVIFEANFDQSLTLYSVPISGGTPVALSQNNQQLNTNLAFRQVSVTNNSRYVVYAKLTGGDDYSVFVSPVTGSRAPVLLTENPSYWRLDDSGEGIYYISSDNLTQLNYVTLSGGAPQLIASLPAGIEISNRIFPEDEPNSTNGVYDPNRHGEKVSAGDNLVVQGSDNNLYHYRYGQQTNTFKKIDTQGLGHTLEVEYLSTRFSPTNDHFLFESSGINIASIGTGQVVKALVGGLPVEAGFSPNGSRVLIATRFGIDLFSVKPDGTGVVKLTPNQLEEYINSISYKVSNDGTHVFFSVNRSSDAVIGGQTFVSPIDGSKPAKLLCDICVAASGYIRQSEGSREPTTIIGGLTATEDSPEEFYYYSELEEELVLFADIYTNVGTRDYLNVTHRHWDESQNSLILATLHTPRVGREDVRPRMFTVYKAKFDNDVPEVTKLFESRNNNCRPLQGTIRVAKPASRLIIELPNSECTKTAYFKLSTTDGTVSQISKYNTKIPSRFVDSNLDMNIEGNDCSEHDRSRYEYFHIQLGNPFIERNKDCLRSISPRGTHIMLPANRRGIGFWGLDLSNELIIDRDEMCFSIKPKSDVVGLVCL